MPDSMFNSRALKNLRESYPDRIQAVIQEFHKQRRAAQGKPRLGYGATPEQERAAAAAIRNEIQMFKNAAHAKLEDLAKEIEEDRGTLEREIGAAFSRPVSKDVQENLLRAINEQRSWARTRPLLEKYPNHMGDTVKELTQRALASNDEDFLGSLGTELSDFLRARGSQHDEIAIRGAFEETIAEHRPKARGALEARKELEPGIYQLNVAIKLAGSAINDETASAVLPEWAKGVTRPVKFE